jgi:glycosyltransferase involved in cell wall biosynthesis
LGGVERALVSVLENIDRSRFKPVLCVLGDAGPRELVPPDVEVVTLGRKTRWSFGRLVLAFRAVVHGRHFDCVVTFSGTANFVALAASLLARSFPPVVVTEHIAPRQMYSSAEEPFGWVKELLIRSLYRRAAAVVAVSRGVAEELRTLGVPGRLITVVHTPVDLSRVLPGADEDVPVWPEKRPVVVNVGRMTLQKNQQLLLEAVAMLRARLPVSVVLVGDGPERPALELVARSHGLDVTFAGADPNPYRWMSRADAFVSSSLFEGFGVVIVEALAVAVPVVSTDCPSGPREILNGGEFGLLTPVGDADALADALFRVLTDEALSRSLRAAGPSRAKTFSSKSATRLLECVISATGRDSV